MATKPVMRSFSAPSGISTHAVNRSFAALSLGTLRAAKRREAEDLIDAADEYDQQFQLPYAGTVAGRQPQSATVVVSFDVPFQPAEGAPRDSPYDKPLFTWGDEQTGPTTVFAHMCVSRWVMAEDDLDEVSGAEVKITVFNPAGIDNDTEFTPFQGIAHINFQGYGAPLADPAGSEETE